MIRLDGIGKSFRVAPGPRRRAGVVEALADVTANFEPGEVVGIVGPNGAGKSTLFGLLLGFLEPTSGDLVIDGLDPRSYVRKHGAAYLPERFLLPRDWPIRGALASLLSLDKSNTDVDKLLDDFELTEYAGAPAHTLSRGTLQRVGLAQAFASARKLVVLDEPTEGLDAIRRIRFRERVQQLKSPDRVVFIASHDLAEVERLADRIIILSRGRVTETIEVTSQSAAPQDYALQLAEDHAAVVTLFEDARRSGDASYVIRAASPADLSARIAALIEAGAVLQSVTPSIDLEARVSRAAQEKS